MSKHFEQALIDHFRAVDPDDLFDELYTLRSSINEISEIGTYEAYAVTELFDGIDWQAVYEGVRDARIAPNTIMPEIMGEPLVGDPIAYMDHDVIELPYPFGEQVHAMEFGHLHVHNGPWALHVDGDGRYAGLTLYRVDDGYIVLREFSDGVIFEDKTFDSFLAAWEDLTPTGRPVYVIPVDIDAPEVIELPEPFGQLVTKEKAKELVDTGLWAIHRDENDFCGEMLLLDCDGYTTVQNGAIYSSYLTFDEAWQRFTDMTGYESAYVIPTQIRDDGNIFRSLEGYLPAEGYDENWYPIDDDDDDDDEYEYDIDEGLDKYIR